MTFAGLRAVRSLLAARLDMSDPVSCDRWKCRYPHYTPGTAASLPPYRLSGRCPQAMAVTKKRAGSPRPACHASWWGPIRTRLVLRRRPQHGVDHMDHAVRLIDVRDRDDRGAALGVDDRHGVARLLDGQRFAF